MSIRSSFRAMKAGICLLLLVGAATAGGVSGSQGQAKGGTAMIISSTVFQEGGAIPVQYTCDDRDISPPLSWSGVPVGAKSLALINDDPDAPMGTWVHWVVYNIPPDLPGFDEAAAPDTLAQKGILQGRTDFGRREYGGPCPPSGTHRYYFKLYALDARLELEQGATKQQVEKAMQGHILEQAQLMGRYTRGR